MRETAEDLAAMQRLIDESHAGAGAHMRTIFDERRRMSAEQVAAELTGMQILALSTVTAGGEPRVAPVEGHLYRGRLHFGSGHDSLRFRHLRARPAVSAAVIRGEELCVIVHGRAVELDIAAPEQAGFLDHVVGVYLDRYGPEWRDFALKSAWARIEPERMFTFVNRG
jgi:nitroimidazol reductase NimA-like FMN-containing flavoprotein (pyridoxamine 5'-phosphate oxidase superfamily)